jgi:hypothetical protein
MPRIQSLLLLCLLTGLVACSSTAKGPITSREYKVQVGGWQDMDQYNHARDHAVKKTDREEDDLIDCVAVVCAENIRKDGAE